MNFQLHLVRIGFVLAPHPFLTPLPGGAGFLLICTFLVTFDPTTVPNDSLWVSELPSHNLPVLLAFIHAPVNYIHSVLEDTAAQWTNAIQFLRGGGLGGPMHVGASSAGCQLPVLQQTRGIGSCGTSVAGLQGQGGAEEISKKGAFWTVNNR